MKATHRIEDEILLISFAPLDRGPDQPGEETAGGDHIAIDETKHAQPIQRLLALQEAAHRSFGVQSIERALAAGEITSAGLSAAAAEYGALTRNLLAACAEILDRLDAPAACYARRFEAALPRWFVVE